MTDIIDRDLILEKITEKYKYSSGDAHSMASQILDIVADAPTVEAEPVIHGYWIPVDGGDSCDEWECSACKSWMTFMYEMEYDDMREDFPRCPKCGAYMDVEE